MEPEQTNSTPHPTSSIAAKLDALPPSVKALVYSADMTKIIQEIGAKHQLHIDQIGILEAETAAVMIGTTDSAQFVKTIANALSVNAQKSAEIVKDINELLFVKIREEMKNGVHPVVAPTPLPAPAPSVVPMPPPIPPPPAPLIAPADTILTEKTVSVAPQTPPDPQPYKADPYREAV